MDSMRAAAQDLREDTCHPKSKLVPGISSARRRAGGRRGAA
uniref:Uncharacterized protein n=1 Tax=Zea mays TaxID=4577 RepID=B6T0H4_MAIZE|nr:hypothetical protein [Zea mays]